MTKTESIGSLYYDCPSCTGALAWEISYAKGIRYAVSRCCGHTHLYREPERPEPVKFTKHAILIAMLGLVLLPFFMFSKS